MFTGEPSKRLSRPTLLCLRVPTGQALSYEAVKIPVKHQIYTILLASTV